jgi:hypothetical protein
MSNRLEKFVQDNRDAFDGDEPRPQLWRDLQQNLAESKKDERIFHLSFLRWTTAAAVVIMIVGMFYYMNRNSVETTHPIVAHNTNPVAPATPDQILNELNPTYAQQVSHFTELIELKQNELKQIGKEHPELYHQFVRDINKLDSSYQALKLELPRNANRELLLETMIQNLKLQSDLLNQQLLIIQKINQSNSKDHDKKSNSI